MSCNGIFDNPANGLPVREVTVDPTRLSLHPAVELFPEMDSDTFQGLKEDMQANGQVDAVMVTEDGQIIDGRHRWKACIALCLRIRVRKFWGEEKDILPHVISTNLKRRHLTESQRAMVAAKLANMKEGRPQKDTAPIGAVSQGEAAEQLNVSRRAVQRATVVRNEGVPELVEAVERGNVPVSVAAKAAKTLTKAEQIDVLKSAPGKLGEAVRKEVAKVEAMKQEVEEANAWVREVNAEMQPPGFDPKKERERVHITHSLYNAINTISQLPDPAQVLAMVPAWGEQKLSAMDVAIEWLTEFQELYKEKVHEAVAANA